MDVIILAGGKGTRLQSVVSDVPKPMAPVNGKPFSYYLLQHLTQYDIRNIILSIGYKGDIIKGYFGDQFGEIPIIYAEETQPLGTGGGIKFASQYSKEENIVVLNGDTWFPIPLSTLWDFHIKEKGLLSIALKELEDFDRYGTVELNNCTISHFLEKKSTKKGLINGGIYILNKQLFQNSPLSDSFSFESDILEKEVQHQTIKGKVFEEDFIDIGIPEDYQKAFSVLK